MPSDGRSDYQQRFERALEGLRAGPRHESPGHVSPGHESPAGVEAGRNAGQDQGIEMDDFVQDTAEMERDLRRRSRLLPVGIALILLSAFGAVIWFAFAAPGAGPEGQQTVELIQADPEPVKTKPEDPGGMQVQHQDKLILNPDPDKPQIERLLPPPEAPVAVEAPTETAETTESLTSQETTASASGSTAGNAPVIVTEEAESDAADAADKAAEAVEDAANTAATSGEQLADASAGIAKKAESAAQNLAKATESAKAEDKPAIPAPPKETVVTPKPVAKPAAVAQAKPAAKAQPATQLAQVPKDSGYILQLASLRSEKDALSEWGRIQRQNSNLLSQMKPIVEKAEIDGVGTRFRLQTGPFPTKATAQDLCAQLKAAKQDCLVKRR